MNKKIKKIDLLIYFSSSLSLMLIMLLLTSSKSISYNIGSIKNYNDNLIDKKIALQEKIKKQDIIAKKTLNHIEEKQNSPQVKPEAGDTIKYVKADLRMQEMITVKDPSLSVPAETAKNQDQKYTVEEGDNLWKIAHKYNMDIYELIKINNIKNPDLILIGQVLNIRQEVLADNSQIKISQTLDQTNNSYLNKSKKFQLIWPLKGLISSEFGVRKSPSSNKMEFHTGIDISAKVGKNFCAAEDGKVVFQGNKGGYGRTIIIEHRNGYKTLYGHSLINFVTVGQLVRKGQVIGRVGETGITTGPHLHFEIIRNNVALDPATMINKRNLFY